MSCDGLFRDEMRRQDWGQSREDGGSFAGIHQEEDGGPLEYQDWPGKKEMEHHCTSFIPFVTRQVTFENCFSLSSLESLAGKKEMEVEVACSIPGVEFSGDDRKSESISMVGMTCLVCCFLIVAHIYIQFFAPL
jgi:hypothetical protein